MVLIQEIGIRWHTGEVIPFAGPCEGAYCGEIQVYGGYRNFGICCI